MTTSTGAESAAQRAYDETKQRIIRGDLVGGTWLSETTVCEELGLSRTPVHEAFLRLAAEQLLTLEARKGAVVRAMSPSEAADVIEMREAVEASAARRAIDRGDAALIEVLRDSIAQQEACRAAGDVDGFVDADDAFHTALVAGSRNPIAVHFSDLLRDRSQRLRHHSLKSRPADLDSSLDDHRELAAAVEAGDPDRFATVLNRHLGLVRGLL